MNMNDRGREIAEMDKEVEKLWKEYEKAKQVFDDWETRAEYCERCVNLNTAYDKWRAATEKRFRLKWEALYEMLADNV